MPYNGTICQDSLIYAYRFQVVTGLRPGELMGLEWGDIDNDYIHIRRAINAKGITTNGKNEFAARDFPQTRYTRMLLESQQVYRVTPLDPHERVFGSTGQLCYRKRWGSIAGITVSLILRRMSCDIPLAQSTKITLATGFTRS